MTKRIVSVTGHSIEEIRARIAQAECEGAEAVELRVDLMEGVSDDALLSLREQNAVKLPLLLTIRSSAEGGQWDRGDDERMSRLIELGPLADYIDIEFATYRKSANIRQKLGLALRRAGHISQQGGVEEIERATPRQLILSVHDFLGRPSTLHKTLLEMLECPDCDVPKIAFRARTLRDNFEAFEIMRSAPRPVCVVCMGPDGLLSRVLANKFGAFATYVAADDDSATAPGQLTMRDLASYRWESLDEATQLYGVIGDPVAHSASPAMHNAAFRSQGLNAVYLPLRVNPTYESFKALMLEILARPWLGFHGFSVTTPHKENALKFLEEHGGSIADEAEQIGAVNTLRVDADGTMGGINTDEPAAIELLHEAACDRGGELAACTAAILGAGGVAHALVAGLRRAGASVTIYNRTIDRARQLAGTFAADAAPWESRTEHNADIVVNCTTIGMAPDVHGSPMSAEALKRGQIVFDTVYNPQQTRFLRDATEAGCVCIGGLGMLTRQARRQFHYWTQREVDTELFEDAARKAIERMRADVV